MGQVLPTNNVQYYCNCGSCVLQMRKRIPYFVSIARQRLRLRPRPCSILRRTCLLFLPLPLVALLALPPDISLLCRSALQSAFRQAKQAPCSPRDAVPCPHACRCRRQARQATGGRRRRVRSIIIGTGGERERERHCAAGAATACVRHRRGAAYASLPRR
jgi:hypothetical protein